MVHIVYCNNNYNHIFTLVPCPEIVQAPLNVTVKPGDMANFSCLAFSHSTLKYEWKDNGHKKLASHSVVFKQGDTMVYFINNTQPFFEGFYCCVAINECGSVQECAWLEVDSKLLGVMTHLNTIFIIMMLPFM